MNTFPPKLRAICGIAGGALLVFNTIAGYAEMHFEFFGAPHLTMNTPMGRSEIMYALSTLMLAGCGAVFFYIGVRALREIR